MKQLVPGFLMTYPTASSRTTRTPWAARAPSQSVIMARVDGAWTSRSICSDQVAVPNEVQTRSFSPVSVTVIDENGDSGFRRWICATSADGASPDGQTLSRVMNRSAYGD